MKIKLSLHRPDNVTTNLAVTTDATARVADVAAALYASDPAQEREPPPGGLTLQVSDGSPARRTLDPRVNILDAGLRSGSTVALAEPSASFSMPGQTRGPAIATLKVISGPDAGREFPMPAGASTVGSGRECDVQLSDPLVSTNHARVNVGAGIEVVDVHSKTGIAIGGRRVVRSPLSASDVVTVGETSFCVVQWQRTDALELEASEVQFSRSPRVVPRFSGQEFVAPELPKRPMPRRFPFLAMIAPLMMGVILYAMTQRLISIVFIALSPIMMLGNWIDARFTARREFADAVAQFEASIAATTQDLVEAQNLERAVRLSELPSVAESLDAALRLGPLLWTHRPEHDQFLRLRLGIGTALSRCVVVAPARNDTLPQYWSRVTDLVADFRYLDGVPIEADLRSVGVIGIAGPPDLVDGVARGLALELVALHSPAELVIVALTSLRSKGKWSWLEWLPHAGSAHSPIVGDHLGAGEAAVGRVLASLEQLVERRGGGGAGPRGPIDPTRAHEPLPSPPIVPVVVAIVEDDAPASRVRLTRLAEVGPDVNVHVIWCARDQSRLPAASRAFLVLNSAQAGATAGHVRYGELSFPITCESLDLEAASRMARGLSPVVDAGAPLDDASNLPRSVSYLSMAGVEAADHPDVVVERWHESRSVMSRGGVARTRTNRDSTLQALVGHGGAGAFFLDLRTQGPHALVGGTTGAGKSEFLQSWVLGMALAYSPDRLSFLFVDYKGGAAFAQCVNLPHTVGLVTDLSPHLVRRALTSLKAELQYRERILNRRKAKDLVSLEREGYPDTPPSLVIIVDEFAALTQEVPDFVDGVVDIAQRGRSLGLHLILATQRPAGVIKDNLRANTNLRIALRMADESDSIDVLGTQTAAHFDPGVPGRGAAKTGPGRIAVFQTGFVGGRTSNEALRPRIEIDELDFGNGARWEVPDLRGEVEPDDGPTDIARLVDSVCAASQIAQIPRPRRPWLDELADSYDLALLPNPRTDAKLLLGVRDDPRNQAQPTVCYEPDRDGNMAIFGTGGTGKSTALRTLALSAAITPRGGPIHVYGIDFGSAGLQLLEGLPHVGAIVTGDDDERIQRTLRMLRDTVDDRSTRYAAVRAATITEYRALAKEPLEPRILLLVDGIGAFREAYEFAADAGGWFATFSQLAADGRQVGVHVILTADRPNAVPTSLGSTIQRRIVLRLASEDDYLTSGVSKDVLSQDSPPGRGIIDGDEMQFAVLGGDSSMAAQSRQLRQLAEAMTRRGVTCAQRIGRTPDHVALSELPLPLSGRPIIGIDDETLEPAVLDVRGPMMLSGPPLSGRTTGLVTLAMAYRAARPDAHILYVAPRRTSLAALGVWDAGLMSIADVADKLDGLSDAIEAGLVSSDQTAVFLELVADFAGTPAEQAVVRLARICARQAILLVGESESSTWSGAFAVAQPFKAGRRGILLAPSQLEGDTLLATSLGRIRGARFPPGRGFLVGRGVARKIQLASPE